MLLHIRKDERITKNYPNLLKKNLKIALSISTYKRRRKGKQTFLSPSKKIIKKINYPLSSSGERRKNELPKVPQGRWQGK